MTYYSAITVAPTNEDWIPGYVGPTTALVAQHGGIYLARTASHERLEGEGDDVGLQVLIEWPTKEAANAFMSDPAYQPLLKARTVGSISQHFLIEGKDDLA
jgi:uncharacterized protein (DUF1330 family)